MKEEMGNPTNGQISMDFYPKDLLTKIFLQVPIRVLINTAKFVCKSWSSHIFDDEFVDLQFAASADTYGVIYRNGSNSSYLVYDSFEDVGARPPRNNTTTFTPPVPETYPTEHSCRGLLLFVNRRDRQPSFVCNPILGSCIPLPLSNSISSTAAFINGLGFEPASKTYKVVRMQCLRDLRTSTEKRFNIDCEVCRIKTIGGRTVTSTWKKMGFLLSSVNFSMREGCSGVYLRGHLYWPIEDINSEQKILAFDLKSEKFKTLNGPSCLVGSRSLFVLDDFRGNLCMVVFDNTNRVNFKIWVMEEKELEGQLWRRETPLPQEHLKFSVSLLQHEQVRTHFNLKLKQGEEDMQPDRYNFFVPSLVYFKF